MAIVKEDFMPTINANKSGLFGMMHVNDFTLKSSEKDEYALYETKETFGFYQALEVEKVYSSMGKEGSLYKLNVLTGNTFGKGRLLLTNSEYFRDIKHLNQYLNHEKYIPPRKRKAIPIRPLSVSETLDYMEQQTWITKEKRKEIEQAS